MTGIFVNIHRLRLQQTMKKNQTRHLMLVLPSVLRKTEGEQGGIKIKHVIHL